MCLETERRRVNKFLDDTIYDPEKNRLGRLCEHDQIRGSQQNRRLYMDKIFLLGIQQTKHNAERTLGH